MREHSYGYQLGVNVIGSPYGNNNESPSTTRRRDVDVSFYPSYLVIVILLNAFVTPVAAKCHYSNSFSRGAFKYACRQQLPTSSFSYHVRGFSFSFCVCPS